MGLKKIVEEFLSKILSSWGASVARSVKRLPLARVMIPESWDGAPHRAPGSAGRLLLPLTLSPLMLFLSRSLSNK